MKYIKLISSCTRATQVILIKRQSIVQHLLQKVLFLFLEIAECIKG